MEYKVLIEHVLPDDAGWNEYIEPGTVISPGDVLVDGDLEPDIMAGLCSSGVIEPADMEAEVARLAYTEPESEDELPAEEVLPPEDE